MDQPNKKVRGVLGRPSGYFRIRQRRQGIALNSEGKEVLPLSFSQEGLWLIDRMKPGNTAYNMMLPISFRGILDVTLLESCLEKVVQRHEILRTTFQTLDGKPIQVIADNGSAGLLFEDLRGRLETGREQEIQRLIAAMLEKPFNLESGPLYRAMLIRLDEDEWLLLIVMHHIIMDDVSTGILHRDLFDLYAAFSMGKRSPLTDLPIQYADYALWQRQWLSGEYLEKHIDYWKQKLQDAPVLNLPTDFDRPLTPGAKGNLASRLLSRELSDGLRAISRQHGLTLFMTLLGVFQLLMQRYSNQDDIVVGTPVTMRGRPELKEMIGFFVNMAVIRTDLSGSADVTELLARVRKVVMDAFVHVDVPFEKLVTELQIQREPGRNPVFQVAFAFESELMSPHEIPGLSSGVVKTPYELTRFDIEAFVRDEPGGLALQFTANADLFSEATITRMLSHYERLLEAVVTTPESRLSELPLLTEGERQQIVYEWNRTQADYPRHATIQGLFGQQAAATPQALALEMDGEQMSYAALDAEANRLAHYLLRQGVAADVPVGVLLERSAPMLVAWLGVLKAGGAYVPLDPNYPQQRLEWMLEDSRAPVLVTGGDHEQQVPGYAGKVVHMGRDAAILGKEPQSCPDVAVDATGLAYIIYTSGSTGTPKGVAVPQRAVVRLVRNTDYLQVVAEDRVAQASNAAFDAATFEVWGALLTGASLIGVSREVLLDPKVFAVFLSEQDISVLFITTAMFNQIAREAPAAFRCLRALLFGGEEVDPASVRRVLAHGRPGNLLHVYGPTESTTFASWQRVEQVAEDATTVPIGGPIANTTLYVLDEHRNPTPVGVAGELYIGGDGVARGYLNRPELTAEKFVPDPFADDAEARLYRTSDRVRYRDDGAVEFLGRFDHQVKLRGFRIELGEVEAALGAHDAVLDSVVVMREDEQGERRLVGYVVLKKGEQVTPSEIKHDLGRHLPDYMLPSVLVVLDELPLNANGKVDREALPAPVSERQSDEEYVMPRSDLERLITKSWCSVLGMEKIGVHDNFFDLGGNSLLLVETHARLSSELDCELSVVDLFEHPTIESLAGHLRNETTPDVLAESARARISHRKSHACGIEQIAIIGMAGRFPGAGDIEAFWAELRDGKEAIRFFTNEEMREAGVPDDMLNDPNYVGARGYLDQADQFDASFFGYSAREAETIDPQQRLLLECASDLLERAGYDPDRYAGLIGVYAGSSRNTYQASLQSQHETRSPAGGLSEILGGGQDFLATRLSYKLNLRGPSVNVQTACSTSLVAVHNACRALADYECDMVLAGGVSVTVPGKIGHFYIQDGIGSPDGHCRAFDAGANGTVGGNGVAMVMLKRLDEALTDGDQIHAVIRGSAINNDGSTKVGYTAPSVEGQAKVITLAQAGAECDPDTIGYIEAHGTGTELGDPIEIAALSRVFGEGRHRSAPCWISSLKTNVGHLDAAAGVTGLIKAALSLEHKELAPSLNFRKPNPQIDFVNTPFRVNTKLLPWESSDGLPLRAGVSSFGLGGTNAHVVLEEAPKTESSGDSRKWQLLCLSAKTAAALENASSNLAAHLREHPDGNLADIAYTLQTGRREFPHRRVVVCRNHEDAAELLEAADSMRFADALHEPGDDSVVFMFSGQGAQYPNMGLGLYRTENVFRETLDDCCEQLRPELGLELRDLLFPAHERLDMAAAQLTRTEFTQPALFVIEYALAKLWISYGIQPGAMTGHSIGEYVAACLADVISLEDALGLVVERGRLMGQLPAGAMLAVPLGEAEVFSLLDEELSVASVNGPGLCVVSGTLDSIAALETRLAGMQIEPTRLHTSHAFHSPMMEPILQQFTMRVREVKLNSPQIPYISNVTGEWITDEQAMDPAYYATHLRQAVQFDKGLELLLAIPESIFLEVGPGQTLASLAKRHPVKQQGQEVITSLRHPREQRDDEAFFIESVGRFWLAGIRPDWTTIHAGQRRRKVCLPTYAFERRRYWIEPNRKPQSDAERLHRKPTPAEWIYTPSWRRAPIPAGRSARNPANWLCFSDGYGLGSHIENELAERGSNVLSVGIGAMFARTSDGGYTLNPAMRDDYDRLSEELAVLDFVPEVIVHLWSVAPDDQLCADEASLLQYQDRGFFSLVFLMQALQSRNPATTFDLAVISSQVHEVNGDELLSPEKAMVMSPCKVIAMEYPGIRTRSIDVALAGGIKSLGQTLVADLCAPWSEPVVAYRRKYRWVQAFEQVRLEAPEGPPMMLRDSGIYMITGGLGGLGLELAAYLAETVSARLVLVGRTPLPSREQWEQWLATHTEDDPASHRIRRVQALETSGAEVYICQADVADEQQMRAAITEAEAHFGPLHGVMHAAGAAKRSVPIQSLQRADCEEQFRPKLQGLRVLESLLAGKRLDFCLVHSSLATIMGVMNFASYTASHLFMDAFVYRHNSEEGTPWYTINWDNWNIHKLNADGRKPGMTDFYMMPDEGADVLSRLLCRSDVPRFLVSTGDLQARIDQWQSREPVSEPQHDSEAASTPRSAYPRPALSTDYAPPDSDNERVLADIWQQMLGIDEVGIHDNFFELGGDSVLNIQIIARANQSGLKVTPKQVFEHQTIAELAAIAGAGEAPQAEQGMVSGAVLLTPVQHWFFERELTRPEHFNLPMLLKVRNSLDMDTLRQAIQLLEQHHDALRLRYSRGESGWSQQIVEPAREVALQQFDVASLTVDEQNSYIEARASELQLSIDLFRGPLLQAACFNLGANRSARLLLVIHHLAVDMISWRILLEDLQTLYTALNRGEDPVLPAKTVSIKSWSTALSNYAQSAEAEMEFWRTLDDGDKTQLPLDMAVGDNSVASSDRIYEVLTEEETRALLTDLPKAYNTQINDALMLALTLAVSDWSGNSFLLVDLEGHGREAIMEGIDLSRTVGWFTTLYPVRLELPVAANAAQQIRSVRDQLRLIPNHGMGFGVLRYLNNNREITSVLESLPRPEISFLYMGQFDQAFSPESLFAPAPESVGPTHDPHGERPYLLEVNCMVKQGRLQMSWTYSRNRHSTETVRSLAQAYMEALRTTISGCRDAAKERDISSSYTGEEIIESDLAEIMRQMGEE